MRWTRFAREGTPSYGIVEDDLVEAVDGTPFGEWRRTGERRPVADITWLPPVVPPTFYCVGLNYADHIVMEAKLRGAEPVLPSKPDVGYRAPSALMSAIAPPSSFLRTRRTVWNTKASWRALSAGRRST